MKCSNTEFAIVNGVRMTATEYQESIGRGDDRDKMLLFLRLNPGYKFRDGEICPGTSMAYDAAYSLQKGDRLFYGNWEEHPLHKAYVDALVASFGEW